MQEEMRHSGINVIGSIPWGTHYCQFYRTKQDLVDILVPYFKAGLENNEFCMWITSEPLEAAEAKDAMRRVVLNFNEYLRKGQIEIIPYDEWYMLGGTFNDDRVLAGWVSKLEQALARGYAGLRLTGNTFWLERNHWQDFTEYEAKVNDVIGKYKMLALCTYSLNKCDAAAVIDVVKNHQFAIIKHKGSWEIIESTIFKQTKQALLESEQDLRRAQSVAHIGSWHLDVRRNELAWSDETHRIFGVPEGIAMTYETFLSSVHPEDRQYVDQKWTAALQGAPYDIEHRIIVGDEVKWVRERAELELDSQGALTGGFGTVQDITESKQAEETIKLAARQWQETFDAMPVLISIHDRDFKIVKVNKACAEAFGMTPEQLIGKPCYQIFHKTDAPIANCPHEHTLRTGHPITTEVFEPGMGAYLDVSTAPNLDTNGEITGSVHIARNITERKQAEVALTHLASFPELNPNPAVEIDAAGNISYLNPAARKLFPDLLELGVKHPFLTEWQTLAKLFENEERQAIIREVNLDNSWYEQSIFYVSTSHTLRLYCRDITEHKKIEQLKDEFIGLTSHELRTPLTVIIGCLSTVLTEWDRLPTSESQQLLRDAILECESLSHLVENLLELSRFQAKQLTLYGESTDIKTLVREALKKIKRQAPTHKFVTSLPDGPLSINADPLRVERILYNLLDNATKYSPAGSRIKVSAVSEPDRLVISVSDRGRGLSPEEQTRLFGPFQRLENNQPYRGRGAGLGLMVCRRLVEAHGGEIWIDSKQGRGSTFSFSLPYKKSLDIKQDSPKKTKRRPKK